MTPNPGGAPGPGPVPGANPLARLAGSAVAAFLTTLVVGAIMIAVAEEYTEARMVDILGEPVGTFLYGIAVLLLLFLATIVLVVTVVGIFVAVPLLLAAYLVWAVGAAIAFLAVGDRLVGHEDGWAKPLVIGAAINGGLTITGIGGIVSFAVGAAGFGAVIRDLLR